MIKLGLFGFFLGTILNATGNGLVDHPVKFITLSVVFIFTLYGSDYILKD